MKMILLMIRFLNLENKKYINNNININDWFRYTLIKFEYFYISNKAIYKKLIIYYYL